MLFMMRNPVQHYHWGTKDFIPNLLKKEVDGSPWAEYWLGSHHKAPSELFYDGYWEKLDSLIRKHQENLLGETLWKKYQDLPFLLKILSIDSPLSLQVHPSREQAKKGFHRENELGVGLDSPQRSYKDLNHKPELLFALGDFWALRGFLPMDQIQENFHWTSREFKEHLRVISTYPGKEQHSSFFRWFMELDSKEEERLLDDSQNIPEHWPEKIWVEHLKQKYPGDISALSPLFLNLIHLKEHEAICQESGEIHAYLRGNGIEIMANSDNVLRAGLTNKHMDVDELLKIGNYHALKPSYCDSRDMTQMGTQDDYSLVHWEGNGVVELGPIIGPRILLVMQGEAIVSQGDRTFELTAGQSVFSSGDCSGIRVKGRNASIFWGQWGINR